MNKLLISVLSAALLVGTVSAQEISKHRVAVSPNIDVMQTIPEQQRDLLLRSSLVQKILDSINNSRKFEVVTRDANALSDIRQEQQFAKSGLAAGDAAQEGVFSNAQSLIRLTVNDFSFGRSSSKVPNLSNKYRISDSGRLDMSVRIIDTSKGTIRGSYPVQVKVSRGYGMSNGVGSANRALLEELFQKAGGEVADKLTDTVFPLEVITTKGKRLYVNRGQDGGMKVGNIFIVFQPGEELIDPKTGENLGSAEEEVGRCKIARVNPKSSTCEVIEGDATSMGQGFILRRPVAETKK